MNPLTEARLYVADSLLTITDLRIYPEPVEAPAPPCIQVAPASVNWCQPRLDNSAEVSVDVRVAVPISGGSAQALQSLERIVWEVVRLMAPASIGSPRVEAVGQADCYIADLTMAVSAKEEAP
jgi:hypothetical protein